MANVLTHRFVSGKADGPDASQIQPSNWNDGHAFTGGNAGDVLTRDPTDATYGAKWSSAGAPYVVSGVAAPVVIVPPDRLSYLVMFGSPGDLTFYGVDPSVGTTFLTGARLRFVNTWGSVVTLIHNAAGVAQYGKLINMSTSATTRLGPSGAAIGGSAEYVWTGTQWSLIAHDQGAPLPIGITSGNLWGFYLSEVRTDSFVLRGRDLHYTGYIVGTVPTPIAQLKLYSLPWEFAGPWPVLPAICSIPTLWSPALVTPEPGGAIAFYLPSTGNWPTGQVYLCFQITLSIA